MYSSPPRSAGLPPRLVLPKPLALSQKVFEFRILNLVVCFEMLKERVPIVPCFIAVVLAVVQITSVELP